MTNQRKNRIHLIYGIVLSAAAVVAGILFILSAYNIYRAGGTQPYTVDTIAAAFSKIAVPVYILIALVLGGMVLQAFLPLEKKKCVPEKNLPLILERLQAKTSLAACDEGLRRAIIRQEDSRRLHAGICGILLAAGGALFLSYACNGENWAGVEEAAKINACMVRAVFAMAICLALPFAYCVFTAFYCKRSYLKQIELMKEAHAQAPIQAVKAEPKASKETVIYIVRYSVLVLAVALVVFGACTGGTADVLAKAAAICTECVGLG